MSLRDQLLKSGLANKEQLKKAEKAAKKRQHEEMQAKKDSPAAIVKDEVTQEIEAKLRQQQECDRELNQQREAERLSREARQRSIDIMMTSDLKDQNAAAPYHFIYSQTQIGCLLVNDSQQIKLAAGKLAIVSFDRDFRLYLVDVSQAEKIKSGNPEFIICWHPAEQGTS